MEARQTDERMPNTQSVLTLIGSIFLAGCSSATDSQVVHGRVSVGDQSPDSGEIRLVPIEGTPGSVNAAVIVDGEYRIEGRGGVPVGNYRVEIVAKRKTGRKVRQYNGFEMAMVDEQIQISPPIYADANSPLTHEVSSHSDNEADFDLPVEKKGSLPFF